MSFNKPTSDNLNLIDGMLSEFKQEHIDYTELFNYLGPKLDFYKFLNDQDNLPVNTLDTDKYQNNINEFQQMLAEKEKKSLSLIVSEPYLMKYQT